MILVGALDCLVLVRGRTVHMSHQVHRPFRLESDLAPCYTTGSISLCHLLLHFSGGLNTCSSSCDRERFLTLSISCRQARLDLLLAQCWLAFRQDAGDVTDTPMHAV